jgi:hypothetical protein
MVTVQGVSSVIVGMWSFSTVVGEIKLEEAPESMRVDITAWSLVSIFISKRGEILAFERHTNSILFYIGPVWV